MVMPAHAVHPVKRFEAFTSIGLAIVLAIAGGIFFFRWGDWEPGKGNSKLWYYLLAWIFHCESRSIGSVVLLVAASHASRYIL